MRHTSHAVHLALASGYCANVRCDFKNKNRDIFRERLKYEMRRRTLPLAVPPETPMRKGCRITVVLSSRSLRSASLSPAILAMCGWRSGAGTSPWRSSSHCLWRRHWSNQGTCFPLELSFMAGKIHFISFTTQECFFWTFYFWWTAWLSNSTLRCERSQHRYPKADASTRTNKYTSVILSGKLSPKIKILLFSLSNIIFEATLILSTFFFWQHYPHMVKRTSLF